jgi:hypothetical protein
VPFNPAKVLDSMLLKDIASRTSNTTTTPSNRLSTNKRKAQDLVRLNKVTARGVLKDITNEMSHKDTQIAELTQQLNLYKQSIGNIHKDKHKRINPQPNERFIQKDIKYGKDGGGKKGDGGCTGEGATKESDCEAQSQVAYKQYIDYQNTKASSRMINCALICSFICVRGNNWGVDQKWGKTKPGSSRYPSNSRLSHRRYDQTTSKPSTFKKGLIATTIGIYHSSLVTFVPQGSSKQTLVCVFSCPQGKEGRRALEQCIK